MPECLPRQPHLHLATFGGRAVDAVHDDVRPDHLFDVEVVDVPVPGSLRRLWIMADAVARDGGDAHGARLAHDVKGGVEGIDADVDHRAATGGLLVDEGAAGDPAAARADDLRVVE